MNVMDTLIWLINFPASHGYMMVFVAGFSIFGLFAMSARAEEQEDHSARSANAKAFSRLPRVHRGSCFDA